MKKICIIGFGHIGLSTACILASKEFKVMSVDTNQKLVEELSQNHILIPEPGLTDLVNLAIRSGKFVNTKRAQLFQ